MEIELKFVRENLTVEFLCDGVWYYEIDLERCKNSAGLLDAILQTASHDRAPFFTPLVVGNLIRVLEEAANEVFGNKLTRSVLPLWAGSSGRVEMNSRFKNSPPSDYTAAVEALCRLAEHDRVRAYADASHESLLDSFRTSRKIKRRDPLGYHVCVHRLKGNRQCPGYARRPPHDWRCPQIPGGDHLSEWTANGKTVAILSQPYGMLHESVAETIKFCEENGLDVQIDTYPSFHYPGVVLSLVFTQKGYYLGPEGLKPR